MFLLLTTKINYITIMVSIKLKQITSYGERRTLVSVESS